MFNELLNEKELGSVLRYFNKNAAKFKSTRYMYAILTMLLTLMGVMMFADNPLFYGFGLVGLFIGYKMPYYNILTDKAKLDELNAHLFADFTSSFIAQIPSTGNVYQTFIACLPYTKGEFKKRLQSFIDEIGTGENPRDAYLDFADYVGSSDAYMIIDMIYQFSVFGTKRESLKELESHIHDMQKNKMDELITRKMAGMDMIGFTPIFISSFLILGFAVVVGMHYVVNDIMNAI